MQKRHASVRIYAATQTPHRQAHHSCPARQHHALNCPALPPLLCQPLTSALRHKLAHAGAAGLRDALQQINVRQHTTVGALVDGLDVTPDGGGKDARQALDGLRLLQGVARDVGEGGVGGGRGKAACVLDHWGKSVACL